MISDLAIHVPGLEHLSRRCQRGIPSTPVTVCKFAPCLLSTSFTRWARSGRSRILVHLFLLVTQASPREKATLGRTDTAPPQGSWWVLLGECDCSCFVLHRYTSKLMSVLTVPRTRLVPFVLGSSFPRGQCACAYKGCPRASAVYRASHSSHFLRPSPSDPRTSIPIKHHHS